MTRAPAPPDPYAPAAPRPPAGPSGVSAPAPAPAPQLLHTMTETCRCGAALTVITTLLEEARADIARWGDRHALCLPRAMTTPPPSGFTR